MSWDLYLKCSHCGTSRDLGNYTHNTNNMIRAASEPSEAFVPVPVAAEVLLRAPVKGLCWSDFHGKQAREAGAFARKIARELEDHPAKYEALNPSNGWGSRESLLSFLRSVAAACDESPDMLFEASG